MVIISRYLIKEIAKHFGTILAVVVAVYLVVDFIEKVDNFLEAGVPLSRAFVYFAYKSPLILVQITPVGVLLAVLIALGLMSKHNELVALRSSGVSLRSLLSPLLRCGIVATLTTIVLAEAAVPVLMTKANHIWHQEVRGQNIVTTRQNDIWMRGDQSIVHLSYFNPDKQTARDVTLHRFDRQFRLVRRIDAQSATFDNGQWVLHQGLDQQRTSRQDQFEVSVFDEQPASLGFTPEDLKQVARKTEEMSFMELYRFVQKVESEGYDATHYRVDLHGKIAFPFVCIIMTFIGAGLAARGKVKEGLPISVSYGMGIAFLYWILFSFCMSLGYAAMLPSFLAAWAVNLISMCLAIYLLINAD